jgi:hypothetical protein
VLSKPSFVGRLHQWGLFAEAGGGLGPNLQGCLGMWRAQALLFFWLLRSGYNWYIGGAVLWALRALWYAVICCGPGSSTALTDPPLGSACGQ